MLRDDDDEPVAVDRIEGDDVDGLKADDCP
jgi:hypothetical protein